MGALFERSNPTRVLCVSTTWNRRQIGGTAETEFPLPSVACQFARGPLGPRNECRDDVIICGHGAALTLFSQANSDSGFSFEEHQSKKVYDLYYCPLPHCLFLGARGVLKKIIRGHAHSNSQLCLATPLAVSSYLRHTSPVRKISLSTNFFHRPRPPLVSIYFFDRQHSHYCTNTTTKVQNVVRCLAYPPASPFSDRATSRKRGILHQAIILDVPSSRTPLNKKISMRLHRR